MLCSDKKLENLVDICTKRHSSDEEYFCVTKWYIKK